MRDSSPTSAAISAQKSALDQTRDELDAAIADYVGKYVDYNAECTSVKDYNDIQDELKAAGKDYNELKSKPLIVALMAIIATTGVGKSSAVDKLIAACIKWDRKDVATMIVVQNYALAKEHADRIGDGVRIHYGRTSPIKCPPERQEFICYKPDVALKAGEKNHRQANTICVNCQHAFACNLQRADDQAAAAAVGVRIPFIDRISDDRIERAQKYFDEKGEDYRKEKPCRFLYEGNAETMKARHIIIQANSFSEAHAWYTEYDENGNVIKRIPRLIFVDENTALAKEVNITSGDVSGEVTGWIDALPELKKELLNTIKIGEEKEQKRAIALIEYLSDVDENDTAKQIKPAPVNDAAKDDAPQTIKACFAKLATDIINGKSFDADGVVALHKNIRKAANTHTGALRWESVRQDKDGNYNIPLRALNALVSNIENNTCWQEEKSIVFYELMPILDWAVNHGSVIFMDATMSFAMRELVKGRNGTLHEATAEQNMHVTMFTGHAYPKGTMPKADAAEKPIQTFKRHMHAANRDLELIAAGLPSPKSILSQINTFRALAPNMHAKNAAEEGKKIFAKKNECEAGYFGLDNKGHNRFDGCNFAIVGSHCTSTKAIASGYGADRAALMQAGVEWDAFNIDEMDSEEVRKEQGGYALPTQPQPRAWYLDKVASETAQAIGRPRAVNSTEKLIIQIWGGLQMTGFIDALAAHGITINEFLPNHVHRTAEDYQSRGSDLNAIHCVIDMLVSLKSSVSKRTVGKALRELGGGADDKVIQQCITDRIALGEIKPATKAHQTPPTAEILMGCDAYKEYICITPHEQNNKNSHLEEVETLLRSVSKKQTIATQPRAAAARKATLFRKQSAFIEEVRGFIDVLAAQGVTINEFMPDDIQVFEEQGDDHG